MPLPFLIPLISTLASGGLAKLLGRPSGAERQAQNNLAELTNASKELALNSGRTGMKFMDAAQGTIAGPKNYFQSIMSGNPGEATTALAPDINRTNQAIQQTTQAQSTLAPRGGGRGESLFNLPYQATGATQSIYNQARPAAAANLADLGVREAAIGSSALGSAGQFVYGATGGANSQLNAELMRRQREYDIGRSMGGLISGAMRDVDWSKLLKTPPFQRP